MLKSESAHMTDQLRKDAPLLSFCIPTYNRVGALLPLVHLILQSPSQEFEIVVSDNVSTDDSVAQLQTIDDPRLVILENEINRGALFNQVNVLIQGRASYSVLLLDKDSVDPAFIQPFLEFLRREAPITGYCEYHKAPGTPARHFQHGYDALQGMAYSCHHPSGYFFRKSDMRELRIVERFSNNAVVGNFPFEFIQAELALSGPAAIFQEPLFIPEELEAARAIRSFTITGSQGDAFFQPKGRLNTAVRFSEHILGLPIETDFKYQMVLARFTQGLAFATVGYRSIMTNDAVCEHYHIATRRVGRLELLQIAVDYYRGFFRELKLVRPSAAAPTGVAVLLYIGHRLFRRIGRRLGSKKLVAEQSS
jgi:hypothetical protein